MKVTIFIVGLTYALTNIAVTQRNFDDDGPLFLSPYIQRGEIQLARDLSRVHAEDYGFDLHSHSAFFTVGPTNNAHYYFWYFEALENPREVPFVVCMNGGPGITSLSGLFGEIGPYYVDKHGRVKWRETNWLTKYNLIFLDAPAGTGFTFATANSDIANTTKDVSADVANALDQFFVLFPPNDGQDLYLLGQGYGAKYCAGVAHLVKTSQRRYSFNLRGIMSMSGMIEPVTQIYPAEYLYQVGVITVAERNSINNDLQRIPPLMQHNQYVKASQILANVVDGIQGPPDSTFKRESGINNSVNILLDVVQPELLSFISFIDESPELKCKLHVGANTPFNARRIQVRDRFVQSGDYVKTVRPELQTILDLDVKVLIFAGNMDPTITTVPGTALAESLQWKCQDRFVHVNNRQIWRVNKNDANSAGYVKCACNFCHATVRNTGHYLPTDEPIRALNLVDRFIHNRRFGTYVL